MQTINPSSLPCTLCTQQRSNKAKTNEQKTTLLRRLGCTDRAFPRAILLPGKEDALRSLRAVLFGSSNPNTRDSAPSADHSSPLLFVSRCHRSMEKPRGSHSPPSPPPPLQDHPLLSPPFPLFFSPLS